MQSNKIEFAECSICIEKSKKMIICPYCKYSACKICIERYLLSSSLTSLKCIECRREWSMSFIRNHMTKTFYWDYLNYRVSLLFEKEKGLLVHMNQQVSYMKNTQKQINKLIEENRNINKEIKKGLNIELIKELKRIRNDNKTSIKVLKTSQNFTSIFSESHQGGQLIHRCAKQGCNGVLDTMYICGTCGLITCHECNLIRDNLHSCDQTLVDTIKIIHENTKLCPCCTIPIHKIDGCDQMWCSKCHTTFSWKTLQIQSEETHNPNYFQWKREQYQIKYDLLPSSKDLIRIFRKLHLIQYDITKPHRIIKHITTLPKELNENDNSDLRMNYLLNLITEKQFKIQLRRREKNKCLKQETQQLLLGFVSEITFLLWKISCPPHIRDSCLQLMCEIEHQRLQYNLQSMKLAKYFRYTVPIISNRWTLTQNSL